MTHCKKISINKLCAFSLLIILVMFGKGMDLIPDDASQMIVRHPAGFDQQEAKWLNRPNTVQKQVHSNEAVMINAMAVDLDGGLHGTTTQESAEVVDLDSELQNVVDKYGLMGLSVTVIADHKIAYEGIFGNAVYEPLREFTRNSVFRIASISKTTVTMGLLQLVEQGLVDLDVDVSHYLGWELQNPKLPDENITLKHLLGHTSGIRDGEGYGLFISDMFDDRLNIRELFQPVGSHYTEDMFANHVPGDFFSYSNAAWSLVATVIEKVSGQRFDRYLNEKIFKPLQMNASFNVTDFDKSEIATLYRKPDGVWSPQVDDYADTDPQERAYEGYEPGHNGLLYSPQGSLRIDTASLQILALTLMNGGEWNGTRVLDASTVEEMSSPNWIYNGNNGNTWEDLWQSYGLGIHLITNREGKDVIFPDRTMWGHPGIAYGLLSDMYVDPDTGSGIIFVTTGSADQFETSEKTSFYSVEQDVFDLVYPYLLGVEERSK